MARSADGSEWSTMEKIDVSCYLHPNRRKAEDVHAPARTGNFPVPKRARTYSVVLGYGFRPSLKPRVHDEQTTRERR
jgi:hypothetical protein